jgi:hypothetical protein
VFTTTHFKPVIGKYSTFSKDRGLEISSKIKYNKKNCCFTGKGKEAALWKN